MGAGYGWHCWGNRGVAGCGKRVWGCLEVPQALMKRHGIDLCRILATLWID